ncbi:MULTISPECIES: hypothetical protein [unclassified Pseudomonas]|jgi:Zn-dependent protease with chaperone function|uniref:hypothetical protein n=1 Tax=unclassified Pseudomonas TaxID=196821 RepID=UPI001179D5F4|nr:MULTISPECIES: hypothetical protein [unclassified Pseudomonas]MCU1720242.1 hypothetical protein [Pseudomonas sp. 5P_5.1_Bac1]MCU1733596.1 hypothetical protein [Pseudomonas sp. 20P_3.2_Bac4]MCU1743260.1 hypothetical protein [Pseudomonas sp. 20P_3.2_Bac5]
MTQLCRNDIVWFCLISLIVPSLVMIYGDAMYAGLYYYLAVPAVALLITIWLSPGKGFLVGLGVALAIEFILVLQINWRSEHQDGMVGVLHMASLPGALIAIVFAGRKFKRRPKVSPLAATLLGSVYVLAGCTLTQVLFYLFFFALERFLVAISG